MSASDKSLGGALRVPFSYSTSHSLITASDLQHPIATMATSEPSSYTTINPQRLNAKNHLVIRSIPLWNHNSSLCMCLSSLALCEKGGDMCGMPSGELKIMEVYL
ncbi:hypothetical protein NPIL_345341 [Nephila pilipes]|uniref:Uncharacterized protein n=1 Tax=Nephila pilipes TaxID=299642 RepID=A0A8X6TFH4_NEPPI|nr:hypothetical protein NPIL_345341 [Nephila pilipes]